LLGSPAANVHQKSLELEW